ncbi:MAG: guanylate kinase [Planctomycetes bacterium]|nr:guanylate kinase [Planctomycetota bacterium]
MWSDGLAPLMVLSGPSGAGKTTILTGLIQRTGWPIRQSVSATTRPPRAGEVPGVHYHFLDRAAFEAEVQAGGFLEHAVVHGHLYGTLVRTVEDNSRDGRATVLAIDVQGFRKVRGRRPVDSSVFVSVPLPELEKRLRLRGMDSEEAIARRLANARGELAASGEYDEILENRELEAAIEKLAMIWERFFHMEA